MKPTDNIYGKYRTVTEFNKEILKESISSITPVSYTEKNIYSIPGKMTHIQKTR